MGEKEIEYIEGRLKPLSADIGVVRDGDHCILYDVGNGEETLQLIPEGKLWVILSHFHADHVGNLPYLADRIERLFVSKETYRHVGMGTIVDGEVQLGACRIFVLPSTHAKGCLGLEVAERYAYVGDALYGKEKDGDVIYNPQLLQQEIGVLEGLKAEQILVSHSPGLVRRKVDVLSEMRDLLSKIKKIKKVVDTQ